MDEGITRAQAAIAIVLTVEDWTGGADDPLHLVRDDDGRWGHTVQCNIDAARDADHGGVYEHETDIEEDWCVWFVDEDTARRALHGDNEECECEECGLTAFIKETRRSGGVRRCRVCRPPPAPKTKEPPPPEPESLPLPFAAPRGHWEYTTGDQYEWVADKEQP